MHDIMSVIVLCNVVITYTRNVSPFFLYFGKCHKIAGTFYVYILLRKIPSLVFLHVRVLLFLRHHNQYCKAE